MGDRVIMSRLVRGRAPGREFDIAFWQKLGPSRIFEAAWDLVVTAAAARGIHEDQLRLQRSGTKFKHGRRPVPSAGRLRDRKDVRHLRRKGRLGMWSLTCRP